MKHKKIKLFLISLVLGIGIFISTTNTNKLSQEINLQSLFSIASAQAEIIGGGGAGNDCGSGYAFYCGYYSWGGPDIYISWVYEGPYIA